MNTSILKSSVLSPLSLDGTWSVNILERKLFDEISSPTVRCITLTRERSNCDTTAAVIMCRIKNQSFWAPSFRWKGSYETVIDSMAVCQLTFFLKSGW